MADWDALLDPARTASLERYARLAAALTGAPATLVSIVDDTHQRVCAAEGFPTVSVPLERTVCRHVVADDVQMAVTDLRDHPLLRHVVQPGVIAYLGSPVHAAGEAVGTVCVVDGRPREWDERERAAIADVAAAVSTELELRVVLAQQHRMATSDDLTGLGNRRALTSALDAWFSGRREGFLGMLDLDGFKAYNDRFGHPAGDELLTRLASRLRDVVAGRGTAFRMGGDEFCVLADEEAALDDAREALGEQGAGFRITASLGRVAVPREARAAAEAIDLADTRLYGAKRSRPGSVDDQVSAALSVAMAERDGYLGGHSGEVARLAQDVARALGLGRDEVHRVGMAARLHDIGKVAIPDAILTKAGPLDEEEWALVRRHTEVGQRIIGAAPALAEVGELIRSSREHFDGSGYPDGRAGGAIPLGARIVCACDAFLALTAERPYRDARSPADALAELRACAGTRFDPRVVEAITRVVTTPLKRV